MLEPLVHIIILNWNSYENTANAIGHLRGLEYSNFRMVVVDNASTDDSLELLKNQFQDVTFIVSKKNLGFGGGNNLGIKRALDHNADYVWIINPDIAVQPDSLKAMMSVAKSDKKIGICAPRLVWKDAYGERLVDGGVMFPDKGYKAKLQTVSVNDAPPTLSPGSFHYAIGCSMLIARETFLKAGFFREDFFLYYEEIEFCLRASGKGFEIKICPKTFNTHDYGTKKKDAIHFYYFQRNRIFLARLCEKYVLKTIVAVMRDFDAWAITHSQKEFKPSVSYWFYTFKAIIHGIFLPLAKNAHA